MKCESITPNNLTYKSSVRKTAIKSTTAAIIGGGILMSQMPDNQPNFTERFFNYIKNIFYKLINNAKISKKKKEYDEKLLDYEKDFINKKLNTSNIDVFDELIKDRYMLDTAISSQINEPETDIMPEVETIFRDPDIPKEERKYIFQLKNDKNTDLKSALIDYKFAVQKRDKIFDFISKYNPQSNREEDVVSEIKDFYTSYKYFENFRNEIHDVENTKILVKDFPDSDYILTMLNSETQENFDLKFKIFKFMEERNLLGNFSAKSSMGDSEYAFNHLNKLNFELAKKLIITDKYIPYEIDKILEITDEKNINALEKVCLDKNIINKRIILSHNSIHYDKKFLQNIRQIDAANADTISAYYELENKGITSVETLINLKPETIELSKKYNIPICLVKTNTINEDNAHFIQRLVKAKVKDTLIETFAEESQKRQGRILLETLFDDKRFNESMLEKFLDEILDDIFDTFNKPYHERKSLPIETFNNIMEIIRTKELSAKQILTLTGDFRPHPFRIPVITAMCRDKNFNKKYILQALEAIREDNTDFAFKLLERKKILNEEEIINILKQYDDQTNDKDVLNLIDSGEYHKHFEIKPYPAKFWRYIIKTGTTPDAIPLFEYYARTDNPNIISEHQQLIKDAFLNRNILKETDEELSDSDIYDYFNDPKVIYTLDLIGRGNLEAVFPQKITEFDNYCYEIFDNKLTSKQLDLIKEVFNPSNTAAYRKLEEEEKDLQKELDKFLSEPERKHIKTLRKQELAIKTQIKTLKKKLKENDKEILAEINKLTKAYKQKHNEIQHIYYNNSNSKEISKIITKINAKNEQKKQYLSERKQKDSPQEAAAKAEILTALSTAAKKAEMQKYLKVLNDNKQWNKEMDKEIFKILKIPYSEKLSQKLDLINSKQFSKLLVSLMYDDEENLYYRDKQFSENLEKLVRIISNDIDSPIENIIDKLPQNEVTKFYLEKININYEKLTKFDKNSVVFVETELDSDSAKNAVIRNLEEDLNDEKFNLLPDEIVEGIRKRIQKSGIDFKEIKKTKYDAVGFAERTSLYLQLVKNDKPIEFSDAAKVISAIKEEMNTNKFWTTPNADIQTEDARQFLYSHLVNQRSEDIKRAKSIKANKTKKLEIRKVDMYNIKKALSLGNDAQCCTALGAISNEWTAPNYIMNKFIGAIEITDNGKSVGNTMFYFAYVDGKPSLILDNIELKTQYQNNNKIRDGFIEYAKKLCAQIGRPDLEIYAGPNRHKVDFSGFETAEHNIDIIGNSGTDRIYLDIISGDTVIAGGQNNIYKKLSLYKLYA